MERLKCTLGYDGTNFSGYQFQLNGRTVQEEIEKALSKMHKGRFRRVTASGRTDAGVHASGQVIHFDTDLSIPPPNWKKALQRLLPGDIQVYLVEPVSDDFHAQYQTTHKEYRYRVLNRKDPDIFRRHYTYFVPHSLDLEAIQQACQAFLGTHDFTSFCSSKTEVKGDKVRTIYASQCIQEGDELVFIFQGSGFLYNMVRIMVGTLLEVGKGIRQPEEISGIIQRENREQAGKTAPPQGLYLRNVHYS